MSTRTSRTLRPHLGGRGWTGGGCRALFAAIRSDRFTEGEMFFDRDGISSSVVDECRSLYDAEITATDHHIGRLLDGLNEVGRLTDALIVVTADHGENLGEKRRLLITDRRP